MAPAWSIRLVLLLGVLGMSSASVLIRGLQHRDLAPLVVAGWRLVLAAAILAPGVWPRRDELPRVVRRHGVVLAVSSLALALHFGAWTASLYRISVARSVVLVNLQPVFVILLAWLLLGERPTRRAWLGLGLAMAGVAVLYAAGHDDSSSDVLGDALAVTGALALAVYVLAGRRLRTTVSLLPYVIPVYGISGAVLLAVAAGTEPGAGAPAGALPFLILLAVLPTLGGHTLFNWALRHVPARVVSAAYLAEPLGAAALAYAFFGERPRGATVAGGLVLLAGVAVIVTGAAARAAEQARRR